MMRTHTLCRGPLAVGSNKVQCLRNLVSARSSSARCRRLQPEHINKRPLYIAASRDTDIVTFSVDELNGAGHGKSAAYKAQCLLLGAIGVAMLTKPVTVIEYAYAATPTVVVKALVQALGSVHILAAVASACLADAAYHCRLSSDTYKRLNAGLAVWATTSVFTFLTASIVPAAPLVLRAYAATLIASALLPLVASEGLITRIRWPTNILPLLNAERAYQLGVVAALSCSGLVVYSLTFPGKLAFSWLTAPVGSLGFIIVRLLGCGALLESFVLYNLMDAAGRRRLGASTFKALNVGVAFVSATLVALLLGGTQILAGPKLGAIVTMPTLPTSIQDAAIRWPDVLFLCSVGITGFLGAIALFNAAFAKKTN